MKEIGTLLGFLFVRSSVWGYLKVQFVSPSSMLWENGCYDMVANKRKEQESFLGGINSMSSVLLALLQ